MRVSSVRYRTERGDSGIKESREYPGWRSNGNSAQISVHPEHNGTENQHDKKLMVFLGGGKYSADEKTS